MLLTITTTHNPATDIGYLLHKHPGKLHEASLSFGQAYVFYPEALAARCTVAVLLDIDPVGLVRKNSPAGDAFALEQYVNDRPYVASSFMSVAINKLFGTLFSGKSKERPELVDKPMPLEVKLPVLPCRGGEAILRRLFEPLDYDVVASRLPLDEKFPEWGESNYFAVTLRRACSLREFLVHLYVLIPVLDNDKHYWIGDDEIAKLLKFGEGWLQAHPEKELITHRYLKHFKSLVSDALERLSEGEPEEQMNDEGQVILSQEEAIEKKINLNQQRLDWVVKKLKSHQAKRVADLGCGEGRLVKELLQDNRFEQVIGCDVSSRALEIARARLAHLPSHQHNRLVLFQTALTYRDKRLTGLDAVTLIEVIEHMDVSRLEALGRVVFEFARPTLVIVTTPNVACNAIFENLAPGQLRHNDHRFEWSRAEFQKWANKVALTFGYSVTFEGIGAVHEQFGTPTQAGVFVRNAA